MFSKVYLGDKNINKIYLGDTLIKYNQNNKTPLFRNIILGMYHQNAKMLYTNIDKLSIIDKNNNKINSSYTSKNVLKDSILWNKTSMLLYANTPDILNGIEYYPRPCSKDEISVCSILLNKEIEIKSISLNLKGNNDFTFIVGNNTTQDYMNLNVNKYNENGNIIWYSKNEIIGDDKYKNIAINFSNNFK